jgi:hypothetical protein
MTTGLANEQPGQGWEVLTLRHQIMIFRFSNGSCMARRSGSPPLIGAASRPDHPIPRPHLTPETSGPRWTTFLRSQAQTILAADFSARVILTGTRMYVLAVMEHVPPCTRRLGFADIGRLAGVGQMGAAPTQR